jgi:RNA polymerase sigma-70 factor (ECF subfamily)
LTEQDAIRRFTALYEQTRSRVYAFAVSHAGRQLADEIVSEVYLVAWRRLADIPRPELPWLLAVARNVAAQQFRSTVRQRSIAAELRAWTTEVELTAGDIGEQVAERQAVLAALATLSGSDRDLLTLVAWHGLTPADAAHVVGCSTAAYFVRLHRARRRLERALHGRARGPDPVDSADPVGRAVPARPAVLSQPEEGIR